VAGASASASWDGFAWTAQPPHTVNGVSAVWSFSPTDTWVAGWGRRVWHCEYNGCAYFWPASINHWDGTAWTAYDQFWGGYSGLWGSSPTDLWAVGSGGGAGLYGIHHWDGTAWSIVAGDMYTVYASVWGSSASDVWVVGSGGVILHWDGAAWSPFPSGVTEELFSVSGTSASDVWAVGGFGTIVHWDGNAWTRWASPVTSTLVSISLRGPDDAWAVASDGSTIHWNGATWSLLPSGLVSGTNLLAAGGGFWLTDGVTWNANARLLELVPTAHAISGRLSGPGVTGVTVTLSGTSNAATTTDPAGRYRFDGLSDGSYTVTPAVPAGRAVPASLNVPVNGADVTGEDFTISPIVP
jgi:hypothetical protein